MKKILLIVLGLFIFSCSNDDDINTDDNENNDLTEIDIDKSFLLNEKWYLYEVLEADSTTNLVDGFETCELDSFYIFELNQENIVVLDQGETECDNEFDRYGGQAYPFSIEEDLLTVDFGSSGILGGFNEITFFDSDEFYISNDASFKLLKAEITYSDNSILEYTLIAYANDRP